MTDDILDIAKWEQKYPFLDKVLDKYKEFNKPIQEDDTSKNNYDNVCYQIISRLRGNIQKHKPYCMKFIRNLGHYSYNTDYFNPTFERCDILYNWLYHSSKSEEIPDNIIKQCFDDYIDQIQEMKKTYKCSYDYYKNMYLEPIKINILKIFNNNTEILRKILIETDDSNKTLCRMFVCECLKIYKYMNETYCVKQEQSQKEKNTCFEVNQFRNSYNIFHNMMVGIDHKIPSLDGAKNEILYMCKPYENIPAKIMSADENSHGHPHSSGDQGLTRPSSSGVFNGENQRSPVSSTVSTALGTVAGASSLLALLYKFTPGRKWLNYGIGGNRGKIHTNFYAEGPSDLLIDGMEHNDFNSYSIGYEAM